MTKTAPHRSLHAASRIRSKKASFIVAVTCSASWHWSSTTRPASTSRAAAARRSGNHHHDETIRGHVFCSFLALVLRKELQDRLTAAGYSPEWADVLRDLESLQSVEVEYQGKRFRLRSEARGTCSQIFQAVGVAFPPTMEQLMD